MREENNVAVASTRGKAGPHGYLPALDGIRALSIILVVLSHAWMGRIVPGGLGVTCFFFISGFIITRLMLVEWSRTQSINVKAFYLRRFVRITPALTVYMAISMLAMLIASVPIQWREVMSVFLFYANYHEIYMGFGTGEALQPFSITWSLAVEEHYYLVFPCLFILLSAHTRQFFGVLLAMCLCVLLWRCYLAIDVGLINLPDDRIYKGTDTRVDAILFGAMTSIALQRYPAARAWLGRRFVFLASALLMLTTLLIRDEIFRETVRYTLQGIAMCGLLVTAVFGAGRLQRLLSHPALRYVGKISYSLYLYHWLVFGLISTYMADQSFFVRVVALIGVSIAAAHLSYKCIELPCLRARPKIAAWLGWSTTKGELINGAPPSRGV